MNKIFITRVEQYIPNKAMYYWKVQLATPNRTGWMCERTIIGGTEKNAIQHIKSAAGIEGRCKIIRMNY